MSETSIGAAIRAAREAKGLSLWEVARLVPCDPSTLAKYERGTIKPSLSTIVQIATVLASPQLLPEICAICPVHQAGCSASGHAA